MKITFMGAGSTVFARSLIGDCMCSEHIKNSTFALYDFDSTRLEQSRVILEGMRETMGGYGKIECYCGVEQRKAALTGSVFVINAIQVGGYDPCTIIDFKIPKKYGLQQTIGDTLGIGGIMRALRTIPVMADFAKDIEQVCPNALLLNYTNPMSMLTGYMQTYTSVNTIGLCHSVQVCAEQILKLAGMEDKIEGHNEKIAGINHMGWLLELRDKDGNDLYPQIREKVDTMLTDPNIKDRVRIDYIKHFGYFCTESSEHNAEYNPFYIKSKYPELIERYRIPLDEYPRRCINQINGWKDEYEKIKKEGMQPRMRSYEYCSRIIDAHITNEPFRFGGNMLNAARYIENLPGEACVEIPCIADATGIKGQHVGRLPVQCAAMNITNINVQLLTIEAAATMKKDHIYQAAMLDPHTGSELDIDTIKKMVDELIEAHGSYLPEYH